MFDAQVRSRQADLAARWLQSQSAGFYTIGSSGHEGNAAVAAALRPTDPALLHYRSGGFYLARCAQVPGSDGVRDILQGIVAAKDDPISGGRHKVFGNRTLHVIPQTSTIGSHLPRAVGVAVGLERAGDLGIATPWPKDAIVVTSFGDASLNHSTVQGALNAASYLVFSGGRVPLLLVCEDNGLGISVPTPRDWPPYSLARRSPIRFESADGCDVVETYKVASELSRWVRENRRPAILHLSVVRLMGHAGSDAEVAYRSQRDIEADYARDPIIGTARHIVSSGYCTATELIASYDRAAEEVRAVAAQLRGAQRLGSRSEVVAPMLAARPAEVRVRAGRAAEHAVRMRAFGGNLPEQQGDLTLARSINAALTDQFAASGSAILFGEDVGAKGGVYGVTRGLQKTFGSSRVFDTLLDEQTILGLALGAALSGLSPYPEIQYLAYLHNAVDQIRGEAASLAFFSNGAYQNGMLIRIAGLAYQRGFGGHFHNDNAVAALRDIPGLIIAVPSHPSEAPALLRSCSALAEVDGRVCVFLEPIALYHNRDALTEGDGLALAPYTAPADWPSEFVAPGTARVHGDGTDLAIVTFGNGAFMSRRVAATLASEGHGVRVLDLRWLAPLPVADIAAQAAATGKVLVVDETRRSGGVSEAVITALVDSGYTGKLCRLTSEDSFIPLGPAAEHVLLQEREIVDLARQMLASA
ncbi:MAG TPA: thiamine pyrophosphate-dependent enzyme [Solirubrobacteraceae bacterium]